MAATAERPKKMPPIDRKGELNLASRLIGAIRKNKIWTALPIEWRQYVADSVRPEDEKGSEDLKS